MKQAILALLLVTGLAQAQTVVITPQGNAVITQSGTTTYVTGSKGTGVAVTPSVNPVTGIGTVHTPQGSYLIQSSGSTTTVVQTSKSK